ncbi:MAG: hypothetical protein HYY96_13980 [Candidatus Tectomicrobia bacterium]|nr:hypothetical protein [Candidatus Tectomicrobia bacterium]
MDEDELREVLRHVLTELKKLRQEVDALRQAAGRAHQRGRAVAVVAMLAFLLGIAAVAWAAIRAML